MNALKILSIAIALTLAACGEKPAASEAAPAAPVAVAPAPAPAPAAPVAAEPAAPVAVASAAAAPSAADLAKGEKVYSATCLACHSAGVMGAPKFGDKAAWGPRIAQGKETVYGNAINGVRMMPPRGGNPGLKDDEVKAAVDYMMSKSI